MKLTIPNQCSLLRIISVPFLFYFAYTKQPLVFGIIFIFASLTDLLDGYFARKQKIESDFGSKLDTFADFSLGLPVLYAFFTMYQNLVQSYFMYLIILIAVVLLNRIIQLLIHHKWVCFHLYTGKLAAVISYIFIVHTFIIGFSEIFFYIAFESLVICQLEETIATFRKKIPGNLKYFFEKS